MYLSNVIYSTYQIEIDVWTFVIENWDYFYTSFKHKL